ncbi:TPA: dATP/dGTP pyrophosphohydrolase domain-containing protein, partial [Salmonella enterica subsp. enterica serovar Muenchen]
SERERIRREHAEWSDKTFGDVGPVGPLKHLSKEALETAAEPDDLSEWADMQFLLWDAQRRAGISDEQITLAMVEKLAVNKKREWPEPKDGEPRLHIKEQPVPAVPDEWTIQDAVKFCRETGRQDAGSAMEGWNACRAAMLQGVEPVSQTYKLNELSGNSPVTPNGWISCSEQMPEDEQEVIVHNKLGYRYVSYFDEHSGLFFDMRGGNQMNCIEHLLVTHWRPMPAPPQQ